MRLLLQRPSTLARQQRVLGSRLFSATDHVHDVLIVGGGVVGSGLARLLDSSMPRLSVGLIERGKGPPMTQASSESAPPHPRCYALSPKSLDILGQDILSKVNPAYYSTMQVWEQDSPSLVLFDAKQDLGGEYLGAVVEDSPLVAALWGSVRDSTTDIQTETQLSGIKVEQNVVHVTTGQDTTLTTRLLVAADGGNSWVRNECKIPWEGFDYNRTALTCTVKLSKEMRGRAFQRFLPHGPLALLPTRLPNHATIVWSTLPQEAAEYKKCPEGELIAKLNSILQQGPQRIPPLLQNAPTDGILGNLAYGIERVVDTVQYGLTMAHWSDHDEVFVAPPLMKEVVGPRFSFPLTCRHASTYSYKNRVALVGDAAHTVHPMAGQGLNLGLEDVDALVKSIEKAYNSGMDITTFMGEFDSSQKLRNSVKMQSIHALHELFGNHWAPVQHAKSLGMHAVNHVGPLKRQLAAVAAGVV